MISVASQELPKGAIEELLNRLSNDRWVLGEAVREFEEEFAKYVGVDYAVALCNGTMALLVAYEALGIRKRTLITTPYTFIATAATATFLGSEVNFVDVLPENACINPLEVIEKARKDAIISVVHIFGYPASVDVVRDSTDIPVVEDCAQAHGAKYKGKFVGSIGHIGTFSFYESKNMMTGEGGMVTTNDDELAERVSMLRDHCEIRGLLEYMKKPDRKWPLVNMLGFNYRMTEVQAAIGLVQLKKLDRNNEKRRELAKILNSGLEKVLGIKPPYVPDYAYHVYHVYCSKYFEEETGIPRKLFVEAVRAEGGLVGEGYTEPLYTSPLYREKLVRSKGCPFTCPFYKGSVDYSNGVCPVAEELCYKRGLWFGIHSELSREDINDCLAAVEKVLSNVEELKKHYKFS